jgi:putative SOS response-associated peptidase YedK
MAGLYEIWRDREKSDDDDDRFVWTCTVLTTSAEDNLGKIHDRMPLLVEPDKFATWLDPRVSDSDKLRSVLVPAAPGRLDAYPVSKAVNNVRNNGPELVDPIPAENELDLDSDSA